MTQTDSDTYTLDKNTDTHFNENTHVQHNKRSYLINPNSFEEDSSSNTNPLDSYSIGLGWSRRESYLPPKFNDFIIEGKHKYGTEKG